MSAVMEATRATASDKGLDYDAIVIGAGMSGLAAAVRLRSSRADQQEKWEFSSMHQSMTGDG